LVAVFPTHTQDKKTNPLNFNEKAAYLQSFLPPGIEILPQGKTLFTVLKYLSDNGYTKVIQVAGSDRIPEYEKLIDMYNNKPSKTQHEILFNIPDYTFKNAGQRDPDKDGLAGMSASEARECAKRNDLVAFSKIVAPAMETKTQAKNKDGLFRRLRDILT